MATTSSSSNALKDAINAKKASLEAQLKAFEGSNVDKLFAERDQLTSKLEEVQSKIDELERHLGVTKGSSSAAPKTRAPKATGGRKKRRTRMSSSDIKDRIMKALGDGKQGLSQKALSEGTSIPYGTVAAYLKANAANFKSTGKLKSKRYFLK